MRGFNVSPLATLRQRFNAVLVVMGLSAGCCLCGGLLTFVAAPNQAWQAYRVSHLPVMTAADVETAAPGEPVLVTGVLADNPILQDAGFVAYTEEVWQVRLPSGDGEVEARPYGRWQSLGSTVPKLNLQVDGQPVLVGTGSQVRLSGALHEVIAPGDGPAEADYQEQPLPDGSRRYRGLANGDLATVLGQKATAGGVVPEHVFAGDRTAFETSQRQTASALLFGGLASLLLAPAVLVAGLLFVVFGRGR